MKRILCYLIFGLVFASCDKYLEVKPTNQLVVSTYDDVKALLAGHLKMYTTEMFTLTETNIPFLDRTSYKVFAYYCDDLDPDRYLNNYLGTNNKSLFYNSLDWQNATLPGILWGNYYQNIGFYNMLEYELGKIEGVAQADRQIVLGEVKFLRAWSLFKLMQYFSPYHNNQLGIPVNLNADAVGSYDARRRTQTEVYDIILSELQEILDYPTAPTSYNIFYDKKLIHALMAQVYHFKGGSGAGADSDWDNAITHAEAAMEGRSLQGIDNFEPLEVEDEILGIFKDKQASLLVVNRGGNNPSYGDIVGEPGWGTYQHPTASLLNLYDSTDVRYDRFFTVADWFGDKTEGVIGKFNKPDFKYGYYALNFFQISDLHLIITESYARKGDNNAAKEKLEEFLRHRIPGYTSYTGNDVLGAILDERRKEFCFEYDMRWCDLVRTQKGWTRKALDKEEGKFYKLEDNDYRFCLPIPLNEELQYNKIDQNPGWGAF